MSSGERSEAPPSGMQLRNKAPKRRVKAKLRDDRAEAVGPNEVWAMDFVHDQLATGKKLPVLTVVDTFSRYVPVLDARFSYRGEDAAATLDRVVVERVIPRRSESIRVASSSRVTWTFGPISGASPSTAPAPANRRTTPSSKLLMAGSEQNA
jgi:putative transposase